jgi:hypothetical protein
VLRFPKPFLLLVTFMGLIAFRVWAETSPDHSSTVTVSVYNDAGVPATVLAQAEQEAQEIFLRAGVDVSWTNCASNPVGLAAEGPDCATLEWPAHLALRIVPRTGNSTDEVFGVAFLSDEGTGCYSDVFYDRVAKLHEERNIALADILGNVMAHELGHLLLGSNSHAGSGIMRAHWQGEELRRVSRGGLWFTKDEVNHIRGLLNARPTELTARSSF